jgi:hypothetical protein
MGFDFAGTYTKIVENKLIEYSFGGHMAQVEFTPGPKGVVIRVMSIGVGMGPPIGVQKGPL